jgi:rubrerythrin
MEQTHTYEELKKKTVAELREMAAGIEHEAVQGYTQLNKEHLLEAICKALNIDMFAHRKAMGIAKTAIKGKIKTLKKKRDEALTAHKLKQLKMVRRQIHGLKRKIRRAMV